MRKIRVKSIADLFASKGFLRNAGTPADIITDFETETSYSYLYAVIGGSAAGALAAGLIFFFIKRKRAEGRSAKVCGEKE